MKATLKELAIHQAICEGNDTALSKLCVLYGEKIARALSRWHSNIAKKDFALIEEAVNEAFWGYYNNPNTFHPHYYTLQRFLEIAADRDLKNILVREKKHANRQELPEDVELQEKFWTSNMEPSHSPDATIVTKETFQAIQAILEKYFFSETDITLAMMILSGERETEAYSKELGISDLGISEQRVEVKKHKDRIKKVIERNDVETRIKNVLQ